MYSQKHFQQLTMVTICLNAVEDTEEDEESEEEVNEEEEDAAEQASPWSL